jgi:peptidoglycan/LPS O-acetylase OafA/YrhL
LVGRRSRLATPLALGVFLLSAASHSLFPPKFAILLATNFFFLGVLACHLYRMTLDQPRVARLVFAAIAGIVAFGPPVLIGYGQLSMELASLAMFPAMVLCFQLAIPDGNARLNQCLTFLGDMTYASYLLQFPLQIMMIQVLPAALIEAWRGTDAFFVIYVGGLCVLSRLVFIAFERPAQITLRQILLGSRAAASQPDVAPSIA